MADEVLLDEFLVTPPAPSQQAFAPPIPVDLTPYTPQLYQRIAGPPGSAMVGTTALTFGAGLLALLFPTATAPAELDEAPTPPPPPPSKPPGVAEPLEPPNWEDIASEPFKEFPKPEPNPLKPVEDLLRFGLRLINWPADPVEMPPGEPEFLVAPASPSRAPAGPMLDPLNLPLIAGSPYGYAFDYSPGAGPGSAPAPIRTPGVDPTPGLPDLFPFGQPGTRIAPSPTNSPSPDVFGSPLPDVIRNPIGNPFASPSQPITARPRPGSPEPIFLTPARPADPVASAFPEPILTEFGPNPQRPSSDVCQCDKKPKKKKPEKRKNRDVCYRGTYVQHTKGISYKRLEQVPCEAAPKKPKAKRSPKLKPGQFPGLSLTGGQVLDLGAQAVSEFAPIILDWLERRKPKPEPKSKKPSKAKKPRRNRRPKTKVGRLPGTPYTTPFPIGD